MECHHQKEAISHCHLTPSHFKYLHLLGTYLSKQYLFPLPFSTSYGIIATILIELLGHSLIDSKRTNMSWIGWLLFHIVAFISVGIVVYWNDWINLPFKFQLVVLSLVGDGFSGLIGYNWGKVKVRNGRTLEGFLGFIFGELIGFWLFPVVPFSGVLVGCMVVMALVELMADRDKDNVLLLLAAFLLSVSFHLTSWI
eukprot:TRINITY_DN5408_c0_g1_i3.p1 TRINITY_DN5408_c0_g1~~TRINITY_DN5408_c0_g1_i3.p1  ORF type:complete len:197 (-),score=44.46 TRINITY_DN5408_c0_g1_i3:52-642(-)